MRTWKLTVAMVAVALVSGGCTTLVRSSVSSNGAAANGQNVQRTSHSVSDDGRSLGGVLPGEGTQLPVAVRWECR